MTCSIVLLLFSFIFFVRSCEESVNTSFHRVQFLLLAGDYVQACEIAKGILKENDGNKLAEYQWSIACSAEEIFLKKDPVKSYETLLHSVYLVRNKTVEPNIVMDNVVDTVFVKIIKIDLQNGNIQRGFEVSNNGVKLFPFNPHVKKLSYVAHAMVLMRQGKYDQAVSVTERAALEFEDIYDWVQQISCQFIPFNTIDSFQEMYEADGEKYAENFEMCYLVFVKENEDFFRFFYKLKIAHSILKGKKKRARGWLNEARKDVEGFSWQIVEPYFNEKKKNREAKEGKIEGDEISVSDEL